METSNGSGSGSLRQTIRKHSLFFFFLLTYAISWIFMTVEVLQSWGYLPGYIGLTAIVNALFTFGPTAAAVIMTSLLEGRAGLHRLRERIRQVNAGWQWYLFILVGIPALVMLGLVIQPGVLASFQGLSPVLLVSYPLNFVAVWILGGPLGEEIGWRGFVLPRLQPRYGPLWGTLILGVFWAFWHLPQFLTPYQGGGPGTSFANFLSNFSRFFLMILALAIIFTWIFNHTHGSIFIAITAHASVNTPELVLLPLFLSASYSNLLTAFLIGFGVTALLILILTRGRLGYKLGQEQPLNSEEIKVQPSF